MIATNRLANRVRHHVDRRFELIHPEFFVNASSRELPLREQRTPSKVVTTSGDKVLGADPRFGTRPLTAEDIRIHAWLTQRQAAVDYERHGVWPRLRRFLFGSRRHNWS